MLRPAPGARKSPIQPDTFGVIRKIGELEQLFNKLQEGLGMVQRALATFQSVKQGAPGRNGTNGHDGRNVTPQEVEEQVRRLFIQPTVTPEEIASVLFASKNFQKFLQESLKHGEDGQDADMETVVPAVIAELARRGIDMANLEARIAEIRNHAATFGSAMRGGGDTIVAGSGVTITNTVNGNKQISASGSTGAWKTPTPTPDGVTTVFTVTSQPIDVVADGIQMFDGAGYVYAALTITFTNPPTQYVRYR